MRVDATSKMEQGSRTFDVPGHTRLREFLGMGFRLPTYVGESIMPGVPKTCDRVESEA